MKTEHQRRVEQSVEDKKTYRVEKARDIMNKGHKKIMKFMEEIK